jgi:5-methylcytosine-specific restriction endonuclease McrA
MSNIINKPISLCLNKNWQAVNVRTIGAALTDLCSSESMGDDSCFALDIDYELNADGTPDFNNAKSIRPVAWKEWCELPVREWDFEIHSPKMIVRAPTVTVAVNYVKMPVKLFRKKPNKEGIWLRDKGVCQYTGKKLDRNSASVDHVLPRSKFKGDPDQWTNMVLCDKEVNFKKGNKLNHEIGLKLLRQPTVPRPMFAFETITEAKDPSWMPFLVNYK